jgi:hypothetical protein
LPGHASKCRKGTGAGASQIAPLKQSLILSDSRVSAPAAVSGFYGEEILLNEEDFVAVDRSHRYSIERVAGVVVKQRVVLNRPAPGEFHYELSPIRYFAVEAAIPLENVITALDFVGVTPFTRKLALSARLQGCTRRHQTEGKRKHSFHA